MLALQLLFKKSEMLCRPYFYTNKLAPSALQLHAQSCSRSSVPSAITELVRKAMAKGVAGGSGHGLYSHCWSMLSPGWLWQISTVGPLTSHPKGILAPIHSLRQQMSSAGTAKRCLLNPEVKRALRGIAVQTECSSVLPLSLNVLIK